MSAFQFRIRMVRYHLFRLCTRTAITCIRLRMIAALVFYYGRRCWLEVRFRWRVLRVRLRAAGIGYTCPGKIGSTNLAQFVFCCPRAIAICDHCPKFRAAKEGA